MEQLENFCSFPMAYKVMNHFVSYTVTFKFHLPGPKLTTPVVGTLFMATAHLKEIKGSRWGGGRRGELGRKPLNRSEMTAVKTLLQLHKVSQICKQSMVTSLFTL